MLYSCTHMATVGIKGLIKYENVAHRKAMEAIALRCLRYKLQQSSVAFSSWSVSP